MSRPTRPWAPLAPWMPHRWRRPGMGHPALQGEGDGEEDRSAALETGMEDWQKPENVALRAELQRWYDHREETSMEQRRADASALMAQVEARQAAGKISETSAALAKLMLLQGAPSDEPQHAARLQEVMALLTGGFRLGSEAHSRCGVGDGIIAAWRAGRQ